MKFVREGFGWVYGRFGGDVWKSFPYTNPMKNVEKPKKKLEQQMNN